jgi:hypothetical protein
MSGATLCFAKNGDGTALALTEDGAYLDSIEGELALAIARAKRHSELGNSRPPPRR